MDDLKKRLVSFFEENSQSIVEDVEKRQNQTDKATIQNLPNQGEKINVPDVGFHLSFLVEAIKIDDESVFTDYIKWAKLLLREHYISEDVIKRFLNLTNEVLNENLSSELFNETKKYLNSGIQQLQEPEEELHSYLSPEASYGQLAISFNEALLRGDKLTASKMIMQEVNKGTSIKDIYLHVFQKSQLEVGRLWLTNEITVAKEHYASAATQLIMSQLYPYIFSTERVGHVFVGACIGGELHELGIRMVCDFFEMDGWDTYYMGANTPIETIISAAEENQADVIGLSISMPYKYSLLREAIDQIRRHFNFPSPRILVGGNGINHNKSIWKFLGADGHGSDAQQAVDLANQLIRKK